jgi:hypothetical protein
MSDYDLPCVRLSTLEALIEVKVHIGQHIRNNRRISTEKIAFEIRMTN